MTREAVRETFGTPEHTARDRRDWFLGGFVVDYDAGGLVEYIETALSPEFEAVFDGESLHRLNADAAVAHVGRHGTYDDQLPDLGYSYIFPGLQLSLWRPTVPAPGRPRDDPEGRRFHAVGIAGRGYFEPTTEAKQA